MQHAHKKIYKTSSFGEDFTSKIESYSQNDLLVKTMNFASNNNLISSCNYYYEDKKLIKEHFFMESKRLLILATENEKEYTVSIIRQKQIILRHLRRIYPPKVIILPIMIYLPLRRISMDLELNTQIYLPSLIFGNSDSKK